MKARIIAAVAFLALLVALGGFTAPQASAETASAPAHIPHTLLFCLGTLGLVIIFKARRRTA